MLRLSHSNLSSVTPVSIDRNLNISNRFVLRYLLGFLALHCTALYRRAVVGSSLPLILCKPNKRLGESRRQSSKFYTK